jgi:hypothetical protein
MGPAAGEFLFGCAQGKGARYEPRDADPAGVRTAPPSQHHGSQVSGYHPSKTLDPDLVLPVMR